MPELGTIILVVVTILWLWVALKFGTVNDGARYAFCVVGTVALWAFNVIGLGVIGIAFAIFNKCTD